MFGVFLSAFVHPVKIPNVNISFWVTITIQPVSICAESIQKKRIDNTDTTRIFCSVFCILSV